MQPITPIPGDAKGQNIAIILIVVAVIVIVFLVINKIFGGLKGFLDLFKGIGDTGKKIVDNVSQGLGLEDTPQQASDRAIINKEQEKINTISSPWNSAYWKNAPKGSLLFTVADGDKYATQIYDSVGIITDSPRQALAAIKNSRTKTQISWVSDRFNQKYNNDMFNYLANKFDTPEQMANLVSMITYVNSLPEYKI